MEQQRSHQLLQCSQQAPPVRLNEAKQVLILLHVLHEQPVVLHLEGNLLNILMILIQNKL